MCSNYAENDNDDYNYNEYDYAVQERLHAYHLYSKGSVSWSHPNLDYKIICPPPKDMENSNMYKIPTMDKYQKIKTVDSDFIDEYNCWDWGDLHCQVEQLFLKGWKCEAINKKEENNDNKSKHPISAYLYYASYRRPLLKLERPDFGFGELTKTIAEEWNEMSEKDKGPYIALAKADKERYERESN